jgi:hypothetical protein
MEHTDRNVEGQTALSRLRSGSLTIKSTAGFIIKRSVLYKNLSSIWANHTTTVYKLTVGCTATARGSAACLASWFILFV